MNYLKKLAQKLHTTRLFQNHHSLTAEKDGIVLLLQQDNTTGQSVLFWGVTREEGKFYYRGVTSGEDLADIFRRAKMLECPIDIEQDVSLNDWKEGDLF